MSHTSQQKTKLLARIRRIRGQVEAIEESLQAERACAEVLQQIAAVRGAISGLMAQVLEEHVEGHLLPAKDEARRRQSADELIEVMRTYLK